MATREKAPVGAPCWIDLMSSDVDGAQRFYRELFGWESTEPNHEFAGYVNFLFRGEPVAGLMANDSQGCAPDGWSVYLAVDDAAATAEQAARHDGVAVFAGPHQVGDLGTMVVMTDGGGATVGLWQADTHPGFLVLDEVGAPAHFELYTRDYERSLRFYESTLGWSTFTMSDTDEFRYTGVGDPENPLAGVMDAAGHLAEEVPSHWAVYLRVEDTDRALDLIDELGGTVLSGAADTPYGRLAEVADPTGARFRIVAE